MITETPVRPNSKARRQLESKLQAECFVWAWNERPITRRLLFHVPNENDSIGSNAIKGAMRKSMGVVAGVADLLLLLPKGRWHGLCIEMKTEDGYQRDDQKSWQALVESYGFRYEVIRNKLDFQSLLDEYLALPDFN